MAQSRSFDSTVQASVLFAPLVSTGSVQNNGLPLFVDADTGQPVPFDPFQLKQLGLINSSVLCTLGEKGHGKTATGIALALRLLARLAGTRRMTVSIADMRRNNANPEYLALCRYLGVDEVPLGDYSLNPLDSELGLSPPELLEMVRNSLEHELDTQLSASEVKALRYGLKMVEAVAPKQAQMSLLMVCLRRLGATDIAHYQQALEAAMLSDAADHNSKLAELLDRQPNVSPELAEAAVNLADMLENLLDGPYGKMFGGQHSLASIMTSNHGLAVFDYSQLSDDAITQIQAMMWRVKASAMARGDHSLFCDVEIHDENYVMWRNLVYARAMHKFLKQVRATGTFVIMNTHRLSDYQTVGSESSEQYKLASSMIGDIGLWLLGKHDPAAADDTARRLALTSLERDQLLTLSRGVWGLKIGTQPVRWVRVDLTDIEKQISFSDWANEDMAV